MPRKNIFEVYRLNIVDSRIATLLGGRIIKTNDEIVKVIEESSNRAYDIKQETHKTIYNWSVRDVKKIYSNEWKDDILYFIVSRSIIEKKGNVETDSGVDDGVSEFTPPLADIIGIFISLNRHIALIEKNNEVMRSPKWVEYLKKITQNASRKLGYSSCIALEPIPEEMEITKTFNSFSTITRLRVNLRIPNPELTRYTKDIYQDMREGGIREYLQDMKNAYGISKEKGKRPYATVELANAGYKDGDVLIEGYKGQKHEKIITGKRPHKFSFPYTKDQIHRALKSDNTRMMLIVVRIILDSLDKVYPPERQ